MSSRLVLRTDRWPRLLPTLKPYYFKTAPAICLYLGSNRSARYVQTNNALRRIRNAKEPFQTTYTQCRGFLNNTIPSLLIPPLVFAGLLLTLWTWKCMMMVLFQDKIIYMPSMPPFARSEKMDDYVAMCKPVEWEQRHIKSLDGTKIVLCIGRLNNTNNREQNKPVKDVVICYFQGNGSSLPPRLPILSNVLKSVEARAGGDNTNARYTVIALSYRGYWTSSGRASQAGIELDAQALLSHIRAELGSSFNETELILWGQSIGSGVATTAAARYIKDHHAGPTITALVLETPFTSVRSMLVALYPQKWLPYRYLGPFLWNRWDSEAALRQIALSPGRVPKVLLLPATRDEVVPSEEAERLEALCIDLNLEFTRSDVEGALHSEATVRRDGQQAISKFIADVVRSK